MGLPKHKYWSGLPFPSQLDLIKPGIKSVPLMCPALAGGFLTTHTTWKACESNLCCAMLSCSTVSNSLRPVDYNPPGSSAREDSPGKNTGVSCHALLQGIFPNQGLNGGLLHCRWILYQLNYHGSPWYHIKKHYELSLISYIINIFEDANTILAALCFY